MINTLIVENLVSIYKLVKSASHSEERLLPAEEKAKLSQLSTTCVQSLFKMITALAHPKQTGNTNVSDIPRLVNQIIGYLSSRGCFEYKLYIEAIQHLFEGVHSYGSTKGFDQTKWEKMREKGIDLIKSNITLLSKLNPTHEVTHPSVSEFRTLSLAAFSAMLKVCLE